MKKTAVVWGIFVCCSLFAFSCEQVTDADVEQLRTVCGQIELPDGFYKVRESDMRKNNFAQISVYYRSSLSPDEIKGHFKKQFAPKGWKVFEPPYESGGRIAFKEGKITISIDYAIAAEFVSGEHWYGITCEWR